MHFETCLAGDFSRGGGILERLNLRFSQLKILFSSDTDKIIDGVVRWGNF